MLKDDGLIALAGTANVAQFASFGPDRELRPWVAFDPNDGLETLRGLVRELESDDAGVEITRPIGVTSHVGDVLRRAGVPARLATRNG